MKKTVTIAILSLLAVAANSQTYTVHTNVYHGDTLFVKKMIYTYVINSETRYSYSSHYDTSNVLILDTIPYTYSYKTITNTVSDSVQLNKWPTFNPSVLTTKQDALISGTTIKTVNGVPLLGTGDIPITSATLQTPRLINGQSFNGSADILTTDELLAYHALGL